MVSDKEYNCLSTWYRWSSKLVPFKHLS